MSDIPTDPAEKLRRHVSIAVAIWKEHGKNPDMIPALYGKFMSRAEFLLTLFPDAQDYRKPQKPRWFVG